MAKGIQVDPRPRDPISQRAYSGMSYADAMAVDRLSVTVPVELGEALRACAEAEGLAVSAIVARAIAREVRHHALGAFLDEFERTHGAPTQKQLAEADTLFDRADRLEKRAVAAEDRRARSTKAAAPPRADRSIANSRSVKSRKVA